MRIFLAVISIFCGYSTHLHSVFSNTLTSKFYYSDDITSNESLKNLKKFTLFLRFPANSPMEANSSKEKIVSELKSIGTVVQRSSFINTPSGQALDISNFPNTESSMIYEISYIYDFEGKKLPVVRASLKVLCEIAIESTHEKASSVIWNRTYYFPESGGVSLETVTLKTFNSLMKDFIASYNNANSSNKMKPDFYLISD